MAANKFATILHKNTNRIVVILTYTVLEWVLIALLLLNSLFSYMILKFAEYFGLKPPCLWCSRVDHLFESSRDHNVYRDFVCETHAAEICKLGFCSKHRKLAESQDMCEDCSSSRQSSHGKSMDIRDKIALFSWVKDMGMIKSDSNGEKEIDDGEKDLRCSCCGGARLNKGFYSPYLLFKPSWGVLDYTQRGSFVTTEISGYDDHHQNDGGESSDPCKSDCPTDRFDDEFDGKRNRVEDDEEEEEELEEDEEEDGDSEDNKMLSYIDIGVENKDDDEEEEEEDCFQFKRIDIDEDDAIREIVEEPIKEEDVRKTQFCCIEDASFEMITGRNLGNCSDLDDHRLVPVELIDSITLKEVEFEFGNVGHEKDRDLEGLFDSESQVLKQPELVSDKQLEEEINVQAIYEEDNPSHGDLESVDAGKNGVYLVSHLEEHGTVSCITVCDEVAIEATRQQSGDGDNVEVATERRVEMRDLMQSQASGEELKILDDEARSESLFIGKISHQVSTQLAQAHGSTSSLPYPQADQFTTNGKEAEQCTDSNAFMDENDQLGSKQVEEMKVESRNMPFDQTEQRIRHQFSISSEFNEVEEDRAPETPTSVESFLHLHKKLLLFERKESGTEESLDGGSVVSEMEIGEGVLTVERLKSVLKSERKALSALYAELEEERSASAVAANQTMAMITRLQEEKAAVQMEALQYQRMMEEQSEYDQEALQLLNELMIKREKEKQELEKELEIYRKKVLQYETKEKKKRNNKTSSGRSGSSSTSSNVDSDEISVDLSHEGAEEDGFYNHQENSYQNTPANSVLNLEVMGLETARHLSTLDESLADFEEERQAILEQLKALEEKLFMLDDSEEQFEDVRSVEHLLQDNCEEIDGTKGLVNGFPDDFDGKLHYQDRRNMGAKAKRLLPLFDAIGMENNDEELNEEDHEVSNAIVSQHSAISKFTPDDDKRLAIEEEVDHVYERLQALEADREFLKHCISSLKKGDKGMDLLQEILQHLRDLRSVDLRCRNMGDSLVS